MQNFEDFLISVAIGQTGVNIHPLMSRDMYGFGIDLYELPTLIIYPFESEEETTSGKANGVQIIFDLGKETQRLFVCCLYKKHVKPSGIFFLHCQASVLCALLSALLIALLTLSCRW